MNSNGHAARRLDALKDDFGGPYQMIYANAVLLHFSPKDVAKVLDKAKKALLPDGNISFNLKIGEGEGWSTSKLDGKRYFYYWKEKPLKDLVEDNGYKIVSFLEGKTGHDNGDWFHVIARSL